MIKRNIALVVFICLLLSLIFFTYKDYGVPWDEKVFFNTGKYFVVNLFNTLKIPTNLSTGGFEPTPYHLQGHGVFMDMLTVFTGLLFPNFTFETLHLIRAFFALPIFILLYLIVSRLISKVYGLISMVFLLLFPRFFPEIFYNGVDVPSTLLFTLSLGYFLYYTSTKKTILKSIIFGLILGIAINQRLLLFYLPLLNFVFLFLLQKKNLKKFLLHQFLIFNFLLLTMHLTHPYLLSHPITGLFDMLRSAKQYPWNAAVLFDGQFYQAGTNPLPWYYLPKTMMITVPVITILLFITGTLRILFKIRTTLHEKVANQLLLLYFLCLFFIPFFFVVFLKPTLYDSWRQFLFLTIPLIIVSIEGLHFLLANKSLKIANYKKIPTYLLDKKNWTIFLIGKMIVGIILLLSLLSTGWTMIKLHPFEYLYYNFLAGGLKGAYGNYETDYWGLGYKDAVLWFNNNINDSKKQYKIFVEGDPLSSTTYFRSNMVLTTNIHEADYIITFTRWNFHVRHPGKTIYRIEKEEVPLIFINHVK